MRIDTGLAVLHLFCSPFDDDRSAVDRDALVEAIATAERDGCQVVTAALFGHKADSAFMVLGPDTAPLRAFQVALQAAGLELVESYLSLTEVSEYAAGLPEHMVRDRLYPQLPPPGKPVFCFYPMSKRREAHANWYATPYEQRLRMMHEHGASGRKFAGRVVQLITGSTGLDAYEWGVTLFADSLATVKDVVYTMRFDEASALYGEFGDFWVGELAYVDAIYP